MMRTIFICVLLSCLAISASAEKKSPLSKKQLDEITERGRMLAEYDRAAWKATDAVMETHPKLGDDSRFACQKADTKWTCVFGHIVEGKLLIDYKAMQEGTPAEFKVEHQEPPAEDKGFFLAAIRAIFTTMKDFHLTAEDRPYNPSVLPGPSGQLYVYIVPAQTQTSVFPMGGDARYLVSADGNTIVEKRQLHKAILEIKTEESGGRTTAGGFHTHVLSDVPEDTDVFYVLSRRPLVPEYIGTGDKKNLIIYEVDTYGSIWVSK